MTLSSLTALLPLLVLIVAALAVLAAATVRRSARAGAWITLGGLGASLACVLAIAGRAPTTVSDLIAVDGYSLFFTALLVVTALVVCLLSMSYWKGRRGRREEYYLLLITATIGAMVAVSSIHYVSFVLGIEILSVSFFVLVAYRRDSATALEAGMKYLVLSGVSSAFLLFGVALTYAEVGSLRFQDVVSAMATAPGLVAAAGVGMFLVGVGFKMSLVPFHLWTPDVFQAAPAPVVAFIATASKGAIFALLLRYAPKVALYQSGGLVLAVGVIAVLSMVAGNLLALLQRSVRRLLAYSSIAHMGYLLVALLARGNRGVSAAGYYLVVYFLATLGVFGVMVLRSREEREADDVQDFRGLAWQRPGLAAVMAIGMLSLAGLPVTGGFIGKFYLLLAGLSKGLYTLAGVLVGASVIGLFYYLRVVAALFTSPEVITSSEVGTSSEVAASEGTGGLLPGPIGRSRTASGVVLGVLTAALTFLGVYPGPLLTVIAAAIRGIVGG
jgi:NADH-quinone oxidoreductase subunit N